eukprot:119553-Amphidinium_carterae.1
MVIKLVRKLTSHRPVHGWRADYAAFIINVLEEDVGLMLHMDGRNVSGSVSWVYASGSYGGHGGRIWQASPRGKYPPPAGAQMPLMPEGFPKALKGDYLDPYHRWVCFQPDIWHGVEPVRQGTRISLATFWGGSMWRLQPEHWESLHKAGFPVQHLRKIYYSQQCDIMEVRCSELVQRLDIAQLEAGPH